jgi:hypothetical protein
VKTQYKAYNTVTLFFNPWILTKVQGGRLQLKRGGKEAFRAQEQSHTPEALTGFNILYGEDCGLLC